MRIVWEFETEDWMIRLWSDGVRGHYIVEKFDHSEPWSQESEEFYGSCRSTAVALREALGIVGLDQVPEDCEQATWWLP